MKFTNHLLKHKRFTNNDLAISPIKVPTQSMNKDVIHRKIDVIKKEIGSFSIDSQNIITACIKTIHNKVIHSNLGEEGNDYVDELHSCFKERLDVNINCKTREEIVVETIKLENKIEVIREKIELLFNKTPELKEIKSPFFSSIF